MEVPHSIPALRDISSVNLASRAGSAPALGPSEKFMCVMLSGRMGTMHLKSAPGLQPVHAGMSWSVTQGTERS